MLGENLKRLAEEIAASYEARMQGIDDLKEGTAQLKKEAGELLGNFAKERLEMAGNTRAELASFKEECQQGVTHLKQATRDLLKDMTARQQEMKKTLGAELGEFRSGLAQYKDDLDAAEDRRSKDAAEEISARKGLIGDIKKETRADLAGFHGARQEMWKDLKSGLGDFMRDIQQFQADLAGSEMERKKRVCEELRDASEGLRSRLSDLMKGLREFQADLVKGEKERKQQTRSHLKDMRLELNAMFRNLRKDLGRFKTDLDKSEKDRKHTTLGELKEMSEDLRDRLAQFQGNISTTVGDFLGELQASRMEGAAAWREILSAVRGGPEPAPKTTTAPAKAAVEEAKMTPAYPPEKPAMESPKVPATESMAPAEAPLEEALTEEKTSQPPHEGLMENIIDLLNDHPEGLKMVEISEKLGLPNWRSLIPVMRELVDEEEVRKDETLYFPV